MHRGRHQQAACGATPCQHPHVAGRPQRGAGIGPAGEQDALAGDALALPAWNGRQRRRQRRFDERRIVSPALAQPPELQAQQAALELQIAAARLLAQATVDQTFGFVEPACLAQCGSAIDAGGDPRGVECHRAAVRAKPLLELPEFGPQAPKAAPDAGVMRAEPQRPLVAHQRGVEPTGAAQRRAEAHPRTGIIG